MLQAAVSQTWERLQCLSRSRVLMCAVLRGMVWTNGNGQSGEMLQLTASSAAGLNPSVQGCKPRFVFLLFACHANNHGLLVRPQSVKCLNLHSLLQSSLPSLVP